MLYLVSKVLMLAVILSSAPYISTAIIIVEMISITMYFKIKKQPLKMNEMLMMVFSFSNFFHEKLKNTRSKNRCLGSLSVLLVHFAYASLISLPLYFLFKFVGFFERVHSVHGDELQLYLIGAFILIGLPSLALICLFEGKVNRWNVLKMPTQIIERVLILQTNRRAMGVCPIQPDVNFTVQNKGEIQMKRQQLKEKRTRI